MSKKTKTYVVGKETYDVPAAELEGFLAEFPDADERMSFVVDKDTFDIPVAEVDGFLSEMPDARETFVDEDGAVSGNDYVEKVKAAVAGENAEVVVLAVGTEADITELETYEERQMFLEDLGLSEPGSAKLIRGAYKLLNLETYFTAGVKEVRAWTIPVGATAPQAAGVIHTDFEKGFIRAEVIAYNDYVSYGSEAKVKEAGKMRVEGKEYIVKDGDVMHFRFNV